MNSKTAIFLDSSNSPLVALPGGKRDVAPAPDNDNGRTTGADTTGLVAHPDLVRYVRATLRRQGVASQDLDDGVADTQTAAIVAARRGRMPQSLAQWKALCSTIAARRAIDRRREAEARSKYNVGLCTYPDEHIPQTMFWEQPDPIDTKRYLALLKELIDSGQLPPDAAEILLLEAEHVPHAEIAAELGISESALNSRLFRIRAKFRAAKENRGLDD